MLAGCVSAHPANVDWDLKLRAPFLALVAHAVERMLVFGGRRQELVNRSHAGVLVARAFLQRDRVGNCDRRTATWTSDIAAALMYLNGNLISTATLDVIHERLVRK